MAEKTAQGAVLRNESPWQSVDIQNNLKAREKHGY
jgi:hypothetical protein